MIDKSLFKSFRVYALLIRYGILIFWGYAALYLWKIGHLDYYHPWGKFLALWIPVLYALFSTGYILSQKVLAQPNAAETCPFAAQIVRFGGYDDQTYIALFLILGLELAAPFLKHIYIWFLIVYLALVFIKTGLLLLCFWSYLRPLSLGNRDASHVLPTHLKILLVGIVFVLYSLVSVFHIQRTTMTGDEPHYLLITHSLWYDHDANLYNNYEDRDYQAFYWNELEPAWGDQVSDTAIYSYRHKGGFPLTLIPGYVLGGRLGVTLQINLIASVLMLQIFLLSYEIFHSLSASFVTWVCMACTIPFMIYMGQIYPDTLAALFVVWGVRRIRQLHIRTSFWEWRFWLEYAFIGLIIGILVLLKTRYAPLAATLVLFEMFYVFRECSHLPHRIRAMVGVLSLHVIGVLMILAADRTLLHGMLLDRITDTKFMTWMLEGYHPLTGFMGLLLDQEYGLFFYTPLYILAVVGIGLLNRRELKDTWPLLGIFGLNYLVVSLWPLWHAAPTPPSRYILPVLPFLGIFLAKFWLQTGELLRNVLLGGCGLWSCCMMWVVTLTPWWRYNWADGTNNFLEAQSWRLAIRLPALFPSFIRLSPLTPVLSLLIILSIVAVIFVVRFEHRGLKSVLSKNMSGGFYSMTILTLFLTLCLGILLAGKIFPSSVLEAEDPLDMKANGGKRVPPSLDPWDNQIYLRQWKYFGWKLDPGDSITARLKFSRGLTFSKRRVVKTEELQIYARAIPDKARPADFPMMELFVDGVNVQNIVVSSESWEQYSIKLMVDKRMSVLKIVHQPVSGSQRSLVLDKLRLR